MSEAAIALNRFGLGGRAEEAPPGDPRAWLLDQFERFEVRPAALQGAPTTQEAVAIVSRYFEERREARQNARSPTDGTGEGVAASGKETLPPPPPGAVEKGADPGRKARREARQELQDAYRSSVGARVGAAVASDTPFVERLVHFWSNHFAVSADRPNVIPLAGAFEFEAIRPHVLGDFRDMLLAVERHPAMLHYLDQSNSIGPGSALGQAQAARGAKRRLGLNENLAREILELHTLGVGSGYTQADVTELARAMTGWTAAGARGRRAAQAVPEKEGFAFVPRAHEPGTRTVLGRSYDQPGEAQAAAVLEDLAAHPATARHLATKLARHFAGDTPPPSLVKRLEASFVSSRGHLPVVYRALIESPEAWNPAPAKFRTPWEWTVAALRALGATELPPRQFTGLMQGLGQPVWRPGSPAGYDDVAASWAAPDALMRRVEAAERLAGRTRDTIDARACAANLFPGALSEATATAIARAESPAQGVALMLVSPEFLRR